MVLIPAAQYRPRLVPFAPALQFAAIFETRLPPGYRIDHLSTISRSDHWVLEFMFAQLPHNTLRVIGEVLHTQVVGENTEHLARHLILATAPLLHVVLDVIEFWPLGATRIRHDASWSGVAHLFSEPSLARQYALECAYNQQSKSSNQTEREPCIAH